MRTAPRRQHSPAGSGRRPAPGGFRGSNARPGLHWLGRGGWLVTVALIALWTVVSGAEPASARSAWPSQPRSCVCAAGAPSGEIAARPASDESGGGATGSGHGYGDLGGPAGGQGASVAAVGGNSASANQPLSDHGNGQGRGQGTGQDGGGPSPGLHASQGNGNGQRDNSGVPALATVGPTVSNGPSQTTGGAQHGHAGGPQGDGGQGRGEPAGGSGHGIGARSTPAPTPPAASASTPAAITPAASPPPSAPSAASVASGTAPSAAGQDAQASRHISRSSSRSGRPTARVRPRSNSSRVGGPASGAGGAAVAARLRARAVLSGSVSPTAAADSGAPARGRTKSHSGAGSSHAAAGSSFLSAPLALPRTIERLVRVVPRAVWLALLATLALAAAAALVAIRAARRGRRQARAIAAAEQIAVTDPLTGVLNRRGFGEAVERELARARRHDHPFALAYLDVRGLKAVNDGDGHLVGDELIRHVANLLRDCARAGDVIGRLGGDEFGLLLAEQSAEGAAIVRRRLHAEVPARRAAIDTDLPWDLTIGTAAYPEDGETFQTLLSAADRRLYAQRGIQLRAAT